LHVAHLNHLIRGGDADADAQFVADLALQWGVPCTVQARDVPAVAHKQKLAIEETARSVRYAFLSQVAQKVGATRVAVGHNADDQSETVLMHWLRGAGLAGLRGMLPVTRMAHLRLFSYVPGGDELVLIRPLLEIERADIERYCRQHSLKPRFDRSNLDTTLYRNKLRHELLPYLERAFKPHFRAILRRSARVIRDDYDLLCGLRDRAWKQTVRQASSEAVIFDLNAWRALHPSLQRATLRLAMQHLRWSLRDVGFKHIESAVYVGREGKVGAQATLPRGVMLTVGYTRLVVADAAFTPSPDFPTLRMNRVMLASPGITPLPGGGWAEVQFVPRAELPLDWSQNTDPWQAFLDAHTLGKSLSLRQRRSGDRFCPLGLGRRHKLVNELLVNEKVPSRWRDQVPLLVREDDEIMWVCGWRIDERARVKDDTAHVAVVRLYVKE
jgi:tRNA(Ile)-lysidine synthase